MKQFMLGAVILSLMATPASAYTDKEAVHAIIGESAEQPYIGQVAVACAIKNRPEGLSGVYGKKMTREPSSREWVNASVAWQTADEDTCWKLIQGADMWENVKAFGQPKNWWAVHFIVQIGDHRFYRRVTSKK